MSTLSQKWKKLRFEIAARDILTPSRDVINAMKEEGWSFKEDANIAPPPMDPAFYHSIIPITPEGAAVSYSTPTETYEQYLDARRQAAQKVYGIT